jgi:hypothetical protein
MEALATILCAVLAGIGATLVICFGLLLRRWVLHRVSLAAALAISHAVIVATFMALYRVPFFWPGPDGDVYIPFMLVPGIHIYFPACWLGRHVDLAFRSGLLERMSFHSASVLVLLIIPGIVCFLVGTLQWYLLGRLWLWLRPNKSLQATAAAPASCD